MANAKRTYFKVVKNYGTEGIQPARYSRYWSNAEKVIRYLLGVMVTTKAFEGSKIFVFDNFDDAKAFATSSDDRIYTCEIQGKPVKPKYVSNSIYSMSTFWQDLTKARKQKKSFVKLTKLKPEDQTLLRSGDYKPSPKGTVWVDGVRLLHDVTDTVDGKPEVKTYYKMVRARTLGSSCWNGSDCITYKVGEFVVPTLKNSKLFIFDSLENAKDFRHSQGRDTQEGCDIYSCEALGVTKAEKMGWSSWRCSDFWYHNIGAYDVPYGTMYSEAVKLIEKVA